jgi:general secretion pathway protein D
VPSQLSFIRQKAASFHAGERSGIAQLDDADVPRKYRYLPNPGCAVRVPVYNFSMRSMLFLAAVAALSVTLATAEEKPAPLLPCPPGASETECNPSRHDLKEAKAAFEHGLKIQQKAPDQAFADFERAAHLVPRNVEYVTARELSRQQLVSRDLEHGNTELQSGKQVRALADFHSALQLDPSNQYAQERLRDAAFDVAPQAATGVSVVEQSTELQLQPNLNLASFHFRGDSRDLLTTIARAYGITAQLDESVASKRVTFDTDDIDFYKAMALAGQITSTFWTPLDGKLMLVAKDTPENRRQYERMLMRKFYVPNATTLPTALNDVSNLLRNVFEIRLVTPNAAASTLIVRAPQRTLDAVTQFLQQLDGSRPQVMLDVYIYQISYTMTRNMGVHIPNQFKIFNIPAGALAALGGQNIQQLINQLIASGGINQANNQALSALLAQLQNQNQQQNSIFSQPLATFGGGKTLTGVSLDELSAELSLNQGWVKMLDHASLRASQSTDATLRLGSRFPILNASFAPIFNTAAISQVIQNNSFQAAFPSFNYEDLGLTVKAKPAINSSSDVGLALEINLRALTGTSINGVPVIGNREYKGSINLLDGEPAVVAGQVSHTETLALSGIPGLGQVPGLNKVTTTNTKQIDDDELLVVITPHITNRSMGRNSEVYLSR